MAYIRVATGYRPGGPNTETPGAAPTFAPDTVTNYEVGLKGTVWDSLLSFDVTAFQINWDDIQLQNTALPSQFLFFENGKAARSRGLELAAELRLQRGLSINGNITLLDAELSETLDPSVAPTETEPGVQRLRGANGERLPFSSKFSGNIGVRQEFDISSSFSGYAGFNVSYVGERLGLFNQNTDGLPGAPVVMPRVEIPSYTVVDLQGGVRFNEMWTLNLYARNVFDEEGFLSIGTRNGTALPQALLIQPRTFGVSLSIEF
jgi:outer membrane receptor protein involved in Fe transport